MNPNTQAFALMVHGVPTDAVAFSTTRKAKADPIYNTRTFTTNGVTITSVDAISINTDKLLCMALAELTRSSAIDGRTSVLDVSMSLADYARLSGYPIDPQSDTDDAKRRAKQALDNARRSVQKELRTLASIELTWTDEGHTYRAVRIITRSAVHNGYIQLTFSSELVAHFTNHKIFTYYPLALLKIRGTNPTPYYLGRKIAWHAYIDSNRRRGTADRLSIPALLHASGLASYSEIQNADRGHWVARIKEPFEAALDELVRIGVLSDWQYVHAKAVALTDAEAYDISSYEAFASLYLQFTLRDPVSEPARLSACQTVATQKERRSKPLPRNIYIVPQSGAFITKPKALK